MAYCLTCFGANMRCLQSLGEPSPQTKYSPSPPITDNPSPRAMILTIQFSLGGTILTLHRSLTKNANQCVKSSLSTPLLFDTELAASHYPRASQLAPSICSGQPSLTWAVPAFKQKPIGHCLSSSDRHLLAFMQIKHCITYSRF